MNMVFRLKGWQRLVTLSVLASCFGTADIAWAHDLSQGHDLPAPLWLYTFSVMATVIASVAMVDTFARGGPLLMPGLQLRGNVMGRWLIPPIAIGSVSVALFIALLMVGSMGDQSRAAKGLNMATMPEARSVHITMPPGITFERCLNLTPDQTLSYRFQAGQPLVFDIHYHAQNVLRYAIREHSADSERRTYTPRSAQEYCLTWRNPASDPVAFSWAFAITNSDDKMEHWSGP